ncbi:hypothetical protein FA15DRAFT_606554, partial [Coprinopsis marcescibilis]
GLVPCAPFEPSTAFTVRSLELYRSLHLRSPHLALQPFVKGLCDIQGQPFHQTWSKQFSIAYDLYLSVLGQVEAKVLATLGRNKAGWRLKNACPACTYCLEDEPELAFKMLVTMDGNDSLKRVARRDVRRKVGEDGHPTLGHLKELQDRREVGKDYYLSQEEMDKWEKEQDVPAPMMLDAGATGTIGEEDRNPCVSQWHNMSSKLTARMWGIFEETSLFLSLCRHGFALVVLDMVRSGEKSKYALAVVDKLLDAFGDQIACGYNIGCRFATTLDQSPLGPRARELKYRSLVGSFHGHAHNRLCQLSNLATYVKGLGLEDLEGCKRMFSRSNALASSTRYASVFHHRQKIEQYFKHMDSMETMASLSKFIADNYRQALSIIDTATDVQTLMDDHSITDSGIFGQWLEEERTYLKGLAKEPVEEMLAIDYYQALLNREKLENLRTTYIQYQPETHSFSQAPKQKGKRNASTETKLWHTTELFNNNLKAVMVLEENMGIENRWEPGSKEWADAALVASNHRYQRCLNRLESLIVSRMFELSKMNMAQTGYKLRKHICKSLQTQSQAIKAALEKFNTAATAMKPPRSPLNWDQVVEYAFLADFDLPRDTRQDICSKPWAQPVPRAIMHQWFKIERAKEEVQRLDVEIRRLVTFIRDEQAFLDHHQTLISATDPVLAFHLGCYASCQTQFFDLHLKRLQRLQDNSRVTTSTAPGMPISKVLIVEQAATSSKINMPITTSATGPFDARDTLDTEDDDGDSDEEDDKGLQGDDDVDLEDREQVLVEYDLASYLDDRG